MDLSWGPVHNFSNTFQQCACERNSRPQIQNTPSSVIAPPFLVGKEIWNKTSTLIYIYSVYVYFVCYHNKEQKLTNSWFCFFFFFFLICRFTIHFLIGTKNLHIQAIYSEERKQKTKKNSNCFFEKTHQKLDTGTMETEHVVSVTQG